MVVIAQWSDLRDANSPEQMVADLLAAQGGEDTFDVLAAARAYRQAVEAALPQGFRLLGSAFHGPSVEGTEYYDGQWQTRDRITLREIHQPVIETAIQGNQDEYAGDDYFWEIAEQHRITEDTVDRLYGTWQSAAGESDVETSVRAALSVWGQNHVEALTETGRYDEETLWRATSGGFGTPSDVVAITSAVRAAVNAALPDGFSLSVNDFRGPHPLQQLDLKTAVSTVDTNGIIAGHVLRPARELWTAEQAAQEIGAASADSARRTLSRWGVRAADYKPHPSSGRLQAVYDADAVRTASEARPGRGTRTDLRA